MKKFLVMVVGVFALCLPVFAGGQKGSAAASGPVSITLGSWWGGNKFGNDPWGQFIKDKFNVDITFVDLEWSDYEQVIRIWAAANQLPDSFSGYPGEQTWFPDLVTQGSLRSLPDEWITKYPNIKKVVDQTRLPTIMRNFFGGYYYIPRPESLSGMKKANNGGFYYRKDWAAKLGIIEVPTDMDTFYDMLYGFTYKDPDGNGRNDTYGLSARLMRDLFISFGAFEDGRWVNGPGGRAIPGYADEEPMIAALTWLRKAWKNNLIDPEFPQDYNIEFSKLMQGIYGCVTGSVHGAIGTVIPPEYADNPTAVSGVIGSMSAHPGGRLYHEVEFDSSGYVFKAGLSDQKAEKILEIMDYLLSDEGMTLCRFGLKDVDYTVDAGGKITRLPNARSYPSNMGHYPVWDLDFSFSEYDTGPQWVREAHWEWYNNPKYGANIGALNGFEDKINLLASVTVTEERSLFPYSDHATREARYLEIMNGDRDVRAMYREFIDECNARGMQAMIDSVNKAMKN
jgi:ABC-type glycerol-3-phosphate transport system substrate-binding protein